MKILITGSTGNIGTQLIKILVGKKQDITAMLRVSEKSKEAEVTKQGVKVVYGDFNDVESLNKALSGIDIAYMLIPSVPTMVQLGSNFIDAAKQQKVKRIVKQSVLGADVSAQVEIPKFHGVIDQELKNAGIAYTIVQPNGFMQNFISSAGSIKSSNALYLNYGEGKFSTVDVRDIAASTAAVLTDSVRENRIYAITGSEAISAKDFADALSKALGKSISYYPISDADAKAAMMGMGMNEWFVDNLVGFGQIFANNWAGYVSKDVETLTGKKPISIQQFTTDFAEHFKQ